jgi:hypothetical protein
MSDNDSGPVRQPARRVPVVSDEDSDDAPLVARDLRSNRRPAIASDADSDDEPLPFRRERRRTGAFGSVDPIAAAVAAAEGIAAQEEGEHAGVADWDNLTNQTGQSDAGSGSDSDASASSFVPTSLSTATKARDTARRRWYLVTWPHPRTGQGPDGTTRKVPGDHEHKDLAGAVNTAYAGALGKPLRAFVVAREHHKSGAVHMHMAVLHPSFHRWKQVAELLRLRGFYVRFDEFNDYFEAVRYLTEVSENKIEADLDPGAL